MQIAQDNTAAAPGFEAQADARTGPQSTSFADRAVSGAGSPPADLTSLADMAPG